MLITALRNLILTLLPLTFFLLQAQAAEEMVIEKASSSDHEIVKAVLNPDFEQGERIAYKEPEKYPKLATILSEADKGFFKIRLDSGALLTVSREHLLSSAQKDFGYSLEERVHVTQKNRLYVGFIKRIFEEGWLEIKFAGYRPEIHHIRNLTPFHEVTRRQIAHLKQKHVHNEKILEELLALDDMLFPVKKKVPESGKKSETCPVCMEPVALEDSSLSCQECGTICHFDDCLAPWLSGHVNQMAGGYTCINSSCQKPLLFEEVSRNKTLAKRYLLAGLDMAATLAPCFRCGTGIIVAEFMDQGFKFQSPCSVCGFSACHRCGFLHEDKNCRESDKTITSEDIDALVGEYGVENVGGCPRCGQILIKDEGCSEMTCGKNFHGEWGKLQSGKMGCGNRFMWEQRLKPVAPVEVVHDPSKCCTIL